MTVDRLSGMRAEVRAGLEAQPRIIPPKFFYDERGSQLFEQITRLPEYYPTRTERGILQSDVAGWITGLAPRSLIELGAGSGEKTRILLEAMLGATAAGVTYVPVDVSADFLATSAERLSREYPALRVEPLVADLNDDFDLPLELPHPRVVAFLGSTIGNFGRADAARLLGRVARALGPEDRMLLGVDLRKDSALLNAAYNDRSGITAEFNRNVLHVLNARLDADFLPDEWRHDARYNEHEGRVEMYLVTDRPQRVTIPQVGTFDFAAGEAILTEISRKYDRPEVEATLDDAGMAIERWFEGGPGYAVVVAGRVRGAAEGSAES